MKLSPASLLHKALLAVCVTLLPIIITFTHSYRENRDFLKNNILDDLTVMAEAYEGQVYQFLEMSKRRMQDFASDESIKKGAKEASSGGLAAGKSLSRYIIKNKLPHDNHITHISIASPKGRIIASTRETSIGKDISGEDYFIKGRDGLTVKEMGKDRNGGPELAVSAPILGDDGELIGVLSGFIRLDYLNDILSGEFNRQLGAISWSKGKRKTMEVYLVNRDRLMITESMFIKGAVLEKKVASLPVKECLELGKEVSAFYKNYMSIEVAGASMCMPSLGWTILAEVDAEEVLAPVTEMRWEAISAAFIVAGFIAVLFMIFYNVIIARLRLLSGAAASIAGGDYDVAIPVKPHDEIGALSDSFNRMAREIERRDKLLRENEERQRAIIDNSTALIFMKDRDGRYMLVNRRVEEVFSLKAEEIIGKTDHELFPKELADNYRENDKRVLETGLPIEAEERAAQNDGIHYYISVKVPVFGPKGTPFAICCIATDITERKKIEQALLESEKGLKRAQEIAQMGSWEWDIGKGSIILTDELRRILGLTPGAGMAFEDFIKSVHPEDAEAVQKSINEALYDKKPYSAEFRIIRPDKSMRVLRAEGEASYNEEGGPVRMSGIAQDITERRRSEEALRKSEENYRALISNIPDVTWTADSRGRVVYISPNIEKICGYTRQEVYSDDRIMLDNIHPADLDRITASFGALFTGDRSFKEEYRLRRKDGQWVWVYDRATAAYERDGVKYADGIFSDITDRKLAEEKVARLNRLFSVLSKINEAIVRIRDTGRLYEEACRIAVEEGRFLLAWIGVIDPETLFVKCVSSHGDGCGYTEGIRISVREDLPEGQGPTGTALREGRFFICNSIETDQRMAPWRDKALGCGFRSSAALPLRLGGRTAGVINLYSGETDMFDGEEIKLLEALAADISFAIETIEAERQGRLAEAARVEARQRYEELVNNLTVGIYRNIELDGGHFEEVNSTAISMLEFSSKEEILKYGVSDFLVDKNKRRELGEKLRRQGFVKCEEMEIQTLKGRRLWASITAVMKRDKSGAAYSDGIIEDITERKRLEDQLRQAQKMEAVGQLAGGVAHDFNNLLTAIIGYGNLLIMKKGEDELVRDYAGHMLTLSEKAANLTQGLLAFSRKQVLNPQPADLNEIVRRVEKILLRLIGEDVELKTELTDEPVTVKVDSTQIEHVMMNLATNSRDAMPGGGTLSISTKTAELGPEYAEAHGYGTTGRYALLSFSDTGAGMDEETKKRIFEPFFTTKEVGRGTGLGLSMVYGIIKQHNGFIDVYSEPGMGTIFRIYLPLISARMKEVESPRRIVKGGSETVLLAEDEEDVRRITKTMLEEFGYRVVEAVNGEEAVEKYKEHGAAISLLILDVVMPKKNGREAYGEIKKINPSIKALFTSGYAAEAMRTRGVIDEKMEFISKPVSPGDFLKKVREVIES